MALDTFIETQQHTDNNHVHDNSNGVNVHVLGQEHVWRSTERVVQIYLSIRSTPLELYLAFGMKNIFHEYRRG